MRTLVASLVVLGLCHSNPNGPDLRVPVQRVLEVVNLDAVNSTLRKMDAVSCLEKYDMLIMDFIRSKDFERIHIYLWTNPQYLEIVKFIADHGYPEVYQNLNLLYQYLELPFTVSSTGPVADTDGRHPSEERSKEPCDDPQQVAKALESVVADEEELIHVVFKILKTDPSIRALIELTRQPEKVEFGRDFLALPEVQRIIEYAKSKAIPVDDIIDFISSTKLHLVKQ